MLAVRARKTLTGERIGRFVLPGFQLGLDRLADLPFHVWAGDKVLERCRASADILPHATVIRISIDQLFRAPAMPVTDARLQAAALLPIARLLLSLVTTLLTLPLPVTFTLTRFATSPGALLARHGIFGLSNLLERLVEQFHLAKLLLHLRQVLRQLFERLGGLLRISLLQALGRLAKLLGKLVEPVLLRSLLDKFIELLLQPCRFFRIAGVASLFDLLFELLDRLPLRIGQLSQLLLHLFELLGELLFLLGGKPLLAELLLKLRQLLLGLFEIAVSYRLGKLFRRAALQIF